MRDFDFKAEYQKLLTPEVVAYLTQIHEYKGQQIGRASCRERV